MAPHACKLDMIASQHILTKADLYHNDVHRSIIFHQVHMVTIRVNIHVKTRNVHAWSPDKKTTYSLCMNVL